MSSFPQPPAPPPPPPPAPEGFRAGRLALGLVIVVVGVAALLQVLDVTNVPWKVVLPGALIAVGLGLVVAGTRSERSQGGLIAIGIVLTVVLAAATAVDIPFEGGVGERIERPTTVASVKDEYRLAMGQLTLDLSQLTSTVGLPQPIRVRVGVGQLVVDLSPNQLVTVHGRAGVGDVTILGNSNSGFDVHNDLVPKLPPGATLRFSLDLSVGIGQVVVELG